MKNISLVILIASVCVLTGCKNKCEQTKNWEIRPSQPLSAGVWKKELTERLINKKRSI